MKVLMFLIALVFSTSVWSADRFILSEVVLDVRIDNGIEKITSVLSSPEDFLTRYRPTGAVISNKMVEGHTFNFNAQKKYLGIPYNVFVSGNLDMQFNQSRCTEQQTGFELTVSFDGSDAIIYENIDSFNVQICVSQINNRLVGSIRPQMIKGSHYSRLLGGVVKDIIGAQIDPILKALVDELILQK